MCLVAVSFNAWLVQGGAEAAEGSQWMKAKRRRTDPTKGAANGHAAFVESAVDISAAVPKVPAVQIKPAPVACQAQGACRAAAVSALPVFGSSLEEERLRHENEELRRALDHERNLLKGMVDNTELMKQVRAFQRAACCTIIRKDDVQSLLSPGTLKVSNLISAAVSLYSGGFMGIFTLTPGLLVLARGWRQRQRSGGCSLSCRSSGRRQTLRCMPCEGSTR